MRKYGLPDSAVVELVMAAVLLILGALEVIYLVSRWPFSWF
jgi:hypothetical protein